MQAQPNETWFDKVREVIASAWEGGWTDGDIQAMFERTIREESDRRTAETARKLYGRDEMQARADEITSADRAQDENEGRS